MNSVRWLKLVLILNMSGLFMACNNDEKKQFSVGEEFISYVERFEQYAATEGHPLTIDNLIVEFGAMENPQQRGICEFQGEGTPKIIIDEANWRKMKEGKKEALMLHELGHCILHRDHVDAKSEGGIPVSLMSPYTISAEIYYAYHKEFVSELFSHSGDF